MRLAFCSIVAAAGTAVMLLTALLPIGTYALPALAGALLIPVVAEAGAGWAFRVYLAEALLTALLAADKEAALLFLLFFGYYPALKAVLERRLRSRALCAAVKLAVFNAAAVLEFWAALRFLGVPVQSYTLFGRSAPLLFLLFGNVVFLVYDYALSLLVVAYYGRFRAALRRWFGGK